MDSTIKRSANVSKPSAMDTTVHKVKLEAKGIACNLFDARAEHLKQLDFSSSRQCQFQLSKVNPFVNSIRKERNVLSTDLTETKYDKFSIFHNFHNRYQYMVKILKFIVLLTL